MASASELAHVAGFRLGRAHVEPATCEIVGGGARETVEPRVMQVLVLLAGADGGTVTRDALIARCWGGRVVSDDAINRVIARVRRIARGPGGDSFEVVTVPRVGYRLRLRDPADAAVMEPEAAAAAEAAPVRRRALRRWGLAGAGVAGAAALLALATSGRSIEGPASPPPPPTFYQRAARDLIMRGAAAVFEGSPTSLRQGVGYYRQALATRSGDADLWGSLALAYAFTAATEPPAAQAGWIARAKAASARGLAIDPRDGHSLAAPLAVDPAWGRWTAKDRAIRAAVARSDGSSPAPVFQLARFEAAVGHGGAALAAIERAYAQHPLVPWINVLRIEMLSAAGHHDEAEVAGEAAAKLWPDDPALWHARFFALLAGGRAGDAQALAERSAGWPSRARPADMALLGRAAAVIGGRAQERAAVLTALEARAGEGQAYAEEAMRLAAFAGDAALATRMAARLLGPEITPVVRRYRDGTADHGVAGERRTAGLFLPPMAGLWRSGAMAASADQRGLAGYWQQTGGPDVCRSGCGL